MNATPRNRPLLLLAAIAVFTALAPASGAPEGDAAAAAVERTYDVHDLLWGAAPAGGPDPADRTRRHIAAELIIAITETVAVDAWRQHGGTDTIVERDARLVVSTSVENHRQIAHLLRAWRRSSEIDGTMLNCRFLVVDEAFLKANAATLIGDGPRATAIGPLKVNELADAVAETPGVLSVVGPPTPLYFRTSSFTIGPERTVTLPDLNRPGRPRIELRRFAGFAASVRGASFRGHVTLDLDLRAATFDASGAADTDEIAAAYRGTITVEQGGRFLLAAPMVRARLAGVRDVAGADGVARREVVREIAADRSDSRRYLLVLGAVRGMTDDEITALAGTEATERIRDREQGMNGPRPERPPQARPPGAPPVPPVPPPPSPERLTYVYDIRGLLLGSEPEAQRSAAREKRIKGVLEQIRAEIPEGTPAREFSGQLIVTAPRATHAAVVAVIDRMLADQLLPRK